MEQILLKIEAAKLEARNLKNRVDKVVNENPSKFSSVHTLKNLVGSADVLTSSEQQKPPLVIKNEVEEPVVSEEKQAKSAAVSSHHDTQPKDDETRDILLSEMKTSVRRREGKAIVSDEKLQKTEQTPVAVEEGPLRSVSFMENQWSFIKPIAVMPFGLICLFVTQCRRGREHLAILTSW